MCVHAWLGVCTDSAGAGLSLTDAAEEIAILKKVIWKHEQQIITKHNR